VTSGLLNTSVVVDWQPGRCCGAAGPAGDLGSHRRGAGGRTAPCRDVARGGETAKRQARLQEVEAKLEPLPFDGTAARSYGLVVAAVVREGRKRHSRMADLLIAPTAHANGLDLYTRDGDHFAGLEDLVMVIVI